MNVVDVEVAEGVHRVRLNSPANRNALSHTLMAELAGALLDAAADPGLRAVQLTGAGPVFCAGADLKATPGGPPPATGLADILLMIWSMPAPTVCIVNGPVRGGGIGLVAACDLSVAVSDATFGFSEVLLGVVPYVISPFVLSRLTFASALDLFLTGRTIAADEAQRIGLVSSTSPPSELGDATTNVIQLLLRGAPGAQRLSKQLIRANRPDIDASLLEEMSQRTRERFTSAEAVEGMAAFAARRPPVWSPPWGSDARA